MLRMKNFDSQGLAPERCFFSGFLSCFFIPITFEFSGLFIREKTGKLKQNQYSCFFKGALKAKALVFLGAALPAAADYVSIDRSRNGDVPYIAITSGEVQKIIGMYQSGNNEKAAARVIMKRAANACLAEGYGELLDFEIESAKSAGQHAAANDAGRVEIISDDSKLSAGMTALAFGSAGLSGLAGLAAGGWREAALYAGIDLGISYGADLALNSLNDMKLKGWLSYRYAYFNRVRCLEEKNLDDSEAGRRKLSYFCPKMLAAANERKIRCGSFDSLGHLQCFVSAKKAGYYASYSFERCAGIDSDFQALCVDAAIDASFPKMEFKLGYAAEHCSKIQTPAQGIVALKAMDQWKPQYAVEQALRIETAAQAAAAVQAMDQWEPRHAVDKVLGRAASAEGSLAPGYAEARQARIEPSEEDFAKTADEECGENEGCETLCDEISSRRLEDDCDSLTVSRAEAMFEVYETLEDADEDGLDEMDIQDFELLARIGSGAVEDLFRDYSRNEAREVRDWLYSNFQETRELRSILENQEPGIFAELKENAR